MAQQEESKNTIEQVRMDGLSHENFFVRSAMLTVLAGDSHSKPIVAERAVEEIEKHGWNGAFEFSFKIGDLSHSENSVKWLVDWLERTAPQSSEETANQQLTMVGWFCDAPIELIRPHINRVVNTFMAALPPGEGSIESGPGSFNNPLVSFSRARFRMEAFCLPTGDCLDHLEKVLSACLQAEGFPHAEVAQLEALCEALAARGELQEEKVYSWLEVDSPDSDRDIDVDDYRAGAALLLLKFGRKPPPVDLILRLMGFNWDWISDLITDVLVRTGNSATLKTLLDRYAALDWAGRLYLAEAFEHLRFPEHEGQLAETLRNETADDLRVNLAYALALYGSSSGTALAREVAMEMPRHPERGAILDLLCAHDILLGDESEETRRHLQKMTRQHADRAKAFARGESLFNVETTADDDVIPPKPPKPPTPRPKRKKKAPVVPFKPATPNQFPGVGRNDPCPCGSGKKFKKCCGP